MTNIQIKSEIKIENNEVKDTIYTGYYMLPSTPLEHRNFIKKDFYLNLDIISSFQFDKIEKDLEVRIEKNNSTLTEKKVILKKGIPFIEFFVIEEEIEIPYMMLAFPHQGEFNRIKRILTDELCIK